MAMLQANPCPVIRAALVLALIAASTPARAQSVDDGEMAEPPRRETIIGGGTPGLSDLQSCVDVEIGGSRSFGCLNQRLKQAVERAHPGLNAPPLDARSPDIRAGIANTGAVKQQYGANYGISVVPWRPAPPAPVMPRR
ncbi:hypothetical protein [Blastochloris tepida]|uniref:hypothetical protein n=1 Tax=Blastochloris tepida TaxID=2233851 RepID=UPI001FCE8BD4|nr:hypothetical protein [Blastochloris tepida]